MIRRRARVWKNDFVVTCLIIQKNGAGIHTGQSCFWDIRCSECYLKIQSVFLVTIIAQELPTHWQTNVRFRTAVCKPIYLLNCFKVLLTKPFQGTVWSRASGCPCSETALLWLD